MKSDHMNICCGSKAVERPITDAYHQGVVGDMLEMAQAMENKRCDMMNFVTALTLAQYGVDTREAVFERMERIGKAIVALRDEVTSCSDSPVPAFESPFSTR